MTDKIEALYSPCRLCGRVCGVDRLAGGTGFCGEGSHLKIAWAGIHRGEEPVICGAGGSGAVFFSGCTLKCFFCQNHQISREGLGGTVSLREFADICLSLQDRGAANINLVTGTHFIPSITKGLSEARSRGLDLPIIWNSSGYDTGEDIELLSDLVDVYVPDLKTLDPSLSAALFGVPDYPRTAAAALEKMAGIRPLVFKGEALASGVIVRHLVLPGLLDNTRRVFAWYAEHLRDKALLSVMFQYTPVEAAGSSKPEVPGEWSRRITEEEYDETLELLDRFGIEEGFIQELPGEENLLPDFSLRDSFPADLATPVWFHRGAAGT